MIQNSTSKFLLPTKDSRRLSILLTIFNASKITQQQIGKETDLSSAMVNNYIKELQEKKLVVMNGQNNRNQTYHLTGEGKKTLKSLLEEYSEEMTQISGTAKSEITRVNEIAGRL